MTRSQSAISFDSLRGIVAVLLSLTGLLGLATPSVAAPAGTGACPGDAGITLPRGFCASVFADKLGHARHLVVAANGVVYVNTWSGAYYNNAPLPPRGFLVALRDTRGTGHADQVERFGDGVEDGAHGGTGIALFRDFLYAEQNDKILRYQLTPDAAVPKGRPDVIVSGLPLSGDHPMHPFIIDANGLLYVDMGSETNSCELKNRMPKSPGHAPCKELATRGGIWRYDATKTGQLFSPRERYATGIRNGEGLSFDASGRLFVTQHGRDQLSENWQNLYTPEQGHELPAEELMELVEHGDYGWPTCYFDGLQRKLVLAPEYGGDGGHAVGACAEMRAPVASFPGHWAPNALLIYTGELFPKPYHGGAFIAFHGSWNRAPAVQAGYNVVYQPLVDGKASADYIVFADGFAGDEKAPGRAAFRPSGLAQGPDGALYIGDDVHGRIWRVTYQGGADEALVSVRAPEPAGGRRDSRPPIDSLPVANGITRELLVRGDHVFHGELSGGTCSGCHSSDARGTEVGPDLASGHWSWGDGSVAAIARTIRHGVPVPKGPTGAMPPLGGAPLSPADVEAVAAYVWAVSHRPGR